jgi:hypothetical protein
MDLLNGLISSRNFARSPSQLKSTLAGLGRQAAQSFVVYPRARLETVLRARRSALDPFSIH